MLICLFLKVKGEFGEVMQEVYCTWEIIDFNFWIIPIAGNKI